MPRAATPEARRVRNAAIRGDRARGWSLRHIARHHGICVALAHRIAGDVYIVLPGNWHRARLPKEAPIPPSWHSHRVYAVSGR